MGQLAVKIKAWLLKAVWGDRQNILFFVGLSLCFFEGILLEQTIVGWVLPTTLWIGGGLVAMPFTAKFLRNYKYTPNLIYKIIYHIGAFGGIMSFAFAALNSIPVSEGKVLTVKIDPYYFIDKNDEKIPHAHITIDGVKIVLRFKKEIPIMDYTFANITLRRGLFGFDRITAYTLVEDAHVKALNKKS